MGIHCMKEIPFRDVYIHALVRDEHGKKMSKSTGNVIDPLKIIDEYGADAFRFTLAAFAAQGRDVKMSESRVEGYRHFVNKLWNASRFVLMHISSNQTGSKDKQIHQSENLSLPEEWILSRCTKTALAVKEGIENYSFNEAASAVYQFVWHEFCDWFLEAAKPALYEKEGEQRRDTARQVLASVLKDILIMLHPFMPFVTEEIFHLLPTTEGSVMAAAFPGSDGKESPYINDGAESNMNFVCELISGIRNIRSEMNIQPSIKIKALVSSVDATENTIMSENKSLIINLATLDSFDFCNKDQFSGSFSNSGATAVIANTTCFVSLEGVIDFDKEISRLDKELDKNTKELLSVQKRLHNESFLEKAPQEVIEKVKNQYIELEGKNQKLKESLERIKQLT